MKYLRTKVKFSPRGDSIIMALPAMFLIFSTIGLIALLGHYDGFGLSEDALIGLVIGYPFFLSLVLSCTFGTPTGCRL